MLWSFSRDGGVPGYKLWSSVNKFTGTPINAGEHQYCSQLCLSALGFSISCKTHSWAKLPWASCIYKSNGNLLSEQGIAFLSERG